MIRSSGKIAILFLCICLLSGPVSAQSQEPLPDVLPDSLTFALPADSASQATDLPPDSAQTETSGVDTTITYSAKTIEFFMDRKETHLVGDASVSYKGMQLSAEKITVMWDENQVIAEGLPDTLWSDSLKTEIDTIVIKGKPVFSESGQNIAGDRMTYNLKSRRGKVIEGNTAYSDGFYWGANIKKDSSEVLYVGPGSFTTCDHEKPHYCFKSYQMKMIRGDKVVAKPVILYFGDVPVAALPYGLFPSRRGRHSGLIIPTYGESGSQGRFIRHLGYYWVTNDYSDLQGTLDYYEESGFLFHTVGRYNWRYHLSGTLVGSYSHRHFGGTKQRRWELRWGHDQEIDPDTRLRINANIISDGSYYQDYSFNLNEQLAQTLRSDATLSHSFGASGMSMTANLHHEQNLRTDEITQNIPRITFRMGQKTIIPMAEQDPDDTTDVEPRWYNNLYYSYSNEYIHKRVLDEQTLPDGSTPLVQDRRSAMKHNINFNSPQKVLKWFNLSPSINYREDWFDESIDYSTNLAGQKDIGFAARRTFSTSLGLSSKLYGYWVNPLPGVEAIRHTMTPSVSLSYRPDFSDPFWGYYEEVTEADGTKTTKDRFAGSLYGGTSRGEQMSLNFSLNNLYQMKYGSGEEKQKRDLFTLNFSTSYNFAADSLRFSPLRSSFRASPISQNQAIGPLKSLSVDLSTSHSFYKYGDSGQYDEYYFAPGDGKFLRLTSFDTSVNTKLALGTLFHSTEKKERDDAEIEADFGIASEETELDTILDLSTPEPGPQKWFMGQVPWDLNLAFHYTTNRSNPNDPTETFWMNASVDASITRNWQISYNTRIDLVEHKVISAGLNIYRDMHCWEAHFTWNPLGIAQGYYVKVSLKSPQLQDIKVEKRRGQGTFMGF